MPLGEAIARIETQVVAPVAGAAARSATAIELTGQAEDLAVTFDALKWSFVLAVVIIYLLMCSLYESWSVPLIVMFSVPLAMTGGVLGLKLVNVLEPTVKLDVVTMLGFIILAGVVVNNAILLVDVALQRMQAGADREGRDAGERDDAAPADRHDGGGGRHRLAAAAWSERARAPSSTEGWAR